jgi:glycosyltransferase involved in cell wall biosynthesis
MTTEAPAISAIITAHREGAMAGISLRSLMAAVERAVGEGIATEVIVALDAPDEGTRAVFADAPSLGFKLVELSLRDQGKVRNHAVRTSRGRFIAFLDGDDLWSENWLVEAHRLCTSEPNSDRAIAHPETDWFFESSNNVFFHADQTDATFDPSILRFANYWDALCMAPRQAYLEHPYCDRDVANGFAYEDWHWNCVTLDAGYVHRVVPDTIHFKRRRKTSQTIQASSRKCLTPPHPLLRYTWHGR